MPRDPNGNVTLPAGNPVVSNTDITTTWGNTTMSDLATMAQDSLSRTWKGGMLVSFKNYDGTETSPGVTFTNETGTGLYRTGVAGELGLAILGVLKTLWTSALITFKTALRLEGTATIVAPAVTVHTDSTTMLVQGIGFGAVQEYALWLGPYSTDISTCTDATGLVWIKKDGTVSFVAGGTGGGTGSHIFSSTATGKTISSVCALGPNPGYNTGLITITTSYNLYCFMTFSSASAYNNVGAKVNPNVKLILSRNEGGAGFVDVATYTATGTHLASPNQPPTEPAEYEQSAAQVFTYTDVVGGTATREWNVRIDSWDVNCTVIDQAITIRSVE